MEEDNNDFFMAIGDVANNLSSINSTVASSIASVLIKPKDERFKSIDEVIDYAVEHYNRIDDVIRFVSEAMGIYFEFNEEMLVKMISSTFDDIRSKMLRIKIFKTTPYWWVIFPNKDRFKDFLKTLFYYNIYMLSSDASFSISKDPSEFTLPQFLDAMNAGVTVQQPEDVENALQLLERLASGEYLSENLPLPSPKATVPTQNYTLDEVFNDIAETVANSPQLNDALFKIGQEVKNALRSAKSVENFPPDIENLLKTINKEVDKHFKLVDAVRKNGATPQLGQEIFRNLYNLNNDLVSLSKALEEIKKSAPQTAQEMAKTLNKILKPSSELLSKAVNQFEYNQKLATNTNNNQIQPNMNTQIQAGQNPNEIMSKNLMTLMNNINRVSSQLTGKSKNTTRNYQLNEFEILESIVEQLKSILNSLKVMSDSEKRELSAKLLILLEGVDLSKVPPELKGKIENVKKQVKEVMKNE